MLRGEGPNCLCRKRQFLQLFIGLDSSLLGIWPAYGCFHQQVVLLNSSLSWIYNARRKCHFQENLKHEWHSKTYKKKNNFLWKEIQGSFFCNLKKKVNSTDGENEEKQPFWSCLDKTFYYLIFLQLFVFSKDLYKMQPPLLPPTHNKPLIKAGQYSSFQMRKEFPRSEVTFIGPRVSQRQNEVLEFLA